MAVRTFTFVEGELIHQYDGTNSHDILPDPLGNVVGLLGANSGIEFDFEYWPYEEVPSAFSSVTPYRYIGAQGYYSDIYSRVYVVARHYRPPYGRWMQVDPLWPVWQPSYQYVNCSPCTFIDPSGKWRWGYSGKPTSAQKDDIWNAIPYVKDIEDYLVCLTDDDCVPGSIRRGTVAKTDIIGNQIRNWASVPPIAGSPKSFVFVIDPDTEGKCKTRCAWVDRGEAPPRTIHLCAPRVFDENICGRLRCVILHELIHAAGMGHYDDTNKWFDCVNKVIGCEAFSAVGH